MNIQIIFAVLVATLIVVVSYRYLNWKAMLYLGGLFLAMATVALFLNYQNDSITWSIPVGDDLFRRGGSVSILGEYRWLALLGLLTGGALMIAGAVKRIRMPPPEPDVPAEEEPLTERERIAQVMDAEIQNVQTILGDPGENGKQDAQTPGGVMPDRQATEPQGFESQARTLYQTRGASFVQDTVGRLKREIDAILAKLETLKNTLVEDFYADKATASYRDNAEEPDPVHVGRIRTAVTDAGHDHNHFVANLKLPAGVHPEWDNPTSTKQLIVWGVIFMLIEFGVSWYFLREQLGGSSAVGIAAYAMAVILLLAIALAGIFQFTRRPKPPKIRVLTGLGYAALLGVLFLGFGLLLEYRAVKDLGDYGLSAQTFNSILNGYRSVLTDLGNLTLFLINLVAFGLFYWKFLLWCERFNGYRRLAKKREQTQQDWDAMSNNNSKIIKSALRHTSKEAKENREGAIQAVNDLHEKKSVLENIQANLTPSVQKLHLAYHNDVNAYRISNSHHRNVAVNPLPAYFKSNPPICATEEHFAGDHGIDQFLTQHQEAIVQADVTRQKIEQSVTDWPNKRAQLNVQWAREFQQKINGAE